MKNKIKNIILWSKYILIFKSITLLYTNKKSVIF